MNVLGALAGGLTGLLIGWLVMRWTGVGPNTHAHRWLAQSDAEEADAEKTLDDWDDRPPGL